MQVTRAYASQVPLPERARERHLADIRDRSPRLPAIERGGLRQQYAVQLEGAAGKGRGEVQAKARHLTKSPASVHSPASTEHCLQLCFYSIYQQ